MTMWVSGSYAVDVLKAARAWQDARTAAINGGIQRFEQNRKGETIPVRNEDVWKALSDAETALSAAVAKHRSSDS